MLESMSELVRGPLVDSLMDDHGADLIPAKERAIPDDAFPDLGPSTRKRSANQTTDLGACSKCAGLETSIHACLRYEKIRQHQLNLVSLFLISSNDGGRE
ncbi:unnamed protein product [Dibothriocephalus latus]|uniref:Uncharacterized protein n=1 Tax=Dibothriocephalus latus TaxID=60516 RepID=A0A3P7RL89_DIBLA|nr:unnamed protein product [Dibothriocephalus latus]